MIDRPFPAPGIEFDGQVLVLCSGQYRSCKMSGMWRMYACICSGQETS